MTRDWDAEYQAKYEQRLADMAQVAYVEYAAREQRRRQMHEPAAPLEPEADPEPIGWEWTVVALAIIFIILGLWEER